jgi:dihydropteroate synthase
MTERVYIRPIALAESPQSEGGAVVRLGGGLIWASRFALIRRSNGRVVARRQLGVGDMAAAIAELPDALAAEAQAQWRDMSRVHPPIACGARVLRLDQPLVMGILNVTPDSFSDGGKFLDQPEAAQILTPGHDVPFGIV